MLKFAVPLAEVKRIVNKSVSVDHLIPRIRIFLTKNGRNMKFVEVFRSFVRACFQAASSFNQRQWVLNFTVPGAR